MRVKSVMLFLKASVVASADTDLQDICINVKSTWELDGLIMSRMGKMKAMKLLAVWFEELPDL